jgi:hypothetical protein
MSLYRSDSPEVSATHVSLHADVRRAPSIQSDRESELDTIQYDVHEGILELEEKLQKGRGGQGG